jgi:hypothetical protein
MPTKRTIIAAGEGMRYEYPADAQINPGDFVQRTATGVQQNALAGSANMDKLIAIEDEIFGRGINPGSGYQAINAGYFYATGDRVLCEALTSGMLVNANLAAGAAAIAIGDPVTGVAGGTVAKGTTANAIGVADEAVDNSGSGSATRIRIRII